MTPKEQAHSIFTKMLFHTENIYDELKISRYIAKQCALIAVDEVIDEIEEFDLPKLRYWIKVKNELIIINYKNKNHD
jgi:hypothetical protein